MPENPLRVLFLVLQAGHGGHTRSALTIARALRDDGVTVKVALPRGRQFAARNDDREHLWLLPERCKWFWHDLTALGSLVRTIRTHPIDLIHSFDPRSHLLGYFLARRLRIPTVGTICGGTIKHYYPFTRPVIVFSHETRDTLVERFGWRRRDVVVEPARVEPVRPGDPTRTQMDERFGLRPAHRLVVMVCRLVSGQKTESVMRALEAVDLLAERYDEFAFLHIGAAADQAALKQVAAKVGDINARHDRRVAITDQSLSGRVIDAISVADAVLGVGRVCFESMSLGKPTAVVGDDGFAGVLGPDLPAEQLDAIGYYNFSGRNVRACPENATPECLARQLLRVLDDPAYARRCGEFGRKWFAEHQDVGRAVKTYHAVYRRIRESQDTHVDRWWRAAWGYHILVGGAIMDTIHRWRNR